MKIFIICSKAFYEKVLPIQQELESSGHIITLPHTFEDPDSENRQKELGETTHSEWKANLIRRSEEVISNIDAVLVLNFEKNGIDNYIGGATFLEMYDAFRLNKKIFLYNDIPDGILRDEISGFGPIVIKGDLSKVS